MIPLKLQIQNFLSYGPELQTIDFSSYRLICLSGKNGHGKSALLDAMTWAIWGMARKISSGQKADQGLLRLGQTAMKVIFDFSFNKVTYRIRREYAYRYNKPWALLEFGMLDEQNVLRPLTDKTIRDTQEKIIQTLKLDYHAFINSAFLRQGNANEFSMKSAKDRKEILGSILGLDAFELIKKRALDQVKLTTHTLQTHESIHLRIAKELEYLPELHAKLMHIQQERTSFDTSLTMYHHKLKHIEQQQATLMHERTHYQQLLVQKDTLQAANYKIIQTLRTLAHEWRTIRAQTCEQQDMHALLHAKQACIEQINKHQESLNNILSLKQQRLQEEQKLHEFNQQIDQAYIQQHEVATKKLHELSLAQAEKKQLSKQYETLIKTYEHELAQIQTNISKMHDVSFITEHTHKLEAQLAQFEKRKQAFYNLKSRNEYIEQTHKELEKNIYFTHDSNNPSCPLCEQNISAARKKFLRDNFLKELKKNTYRIKRFQMVLARLKSLLVEQHAELETLRKNNDLLKKESEAYHVQTTRAIELEKLITETTGLIYTTKQELYTLEQAYHNQETLMHEQKKHMLENRAQNLEILIQTQKIQTIDAALQSIVYDENTHKKDQKQLETLEKNVLHLEQLREKLHEQTHRRKKISELAQELRRIKKEIVLIDKQLAPYDKLDLREQALEQDLQNIQTEIHELQTKKEQVIQEHAHIQADYARLEKLKAEQSTHQQLVIDLKTNIEHYQIIAQALSKNGIQALLIEQIIPEIEAEANTLLAKLTDNQTHIIIDSLKDLKSGGTRETLDIKVSDPLGIRPYELFSGGEAFRIDFSLRIAISKLLARRAGTSLQTLIIDEGFGSQDEEGLNHIMDAIHRIQYDFAKIIIVSHLAHMKEQFPVHFIVDKRPQGSKVTIVEH